MATALQQGLAAQAPPVNANTPDSRIDPRNEQLIAIQRVRASLKKLQEPLDDADPMSQLCGTIHGIFSALIANVQVGDAIQPALAPMFQMLPPDLQQRTISQVSPAMGGGLPGMGMGAPPPMGPPPGLMPTVTAPMPPPPGVSGL
jgi:hypothetical protein